MARDNRLRPQDESPANAGFFALPCPVSPLRIAAIVAVAAAAFLAVFQLAGLSSERQASQPMQATAPAGAQVAPRQAPVGYLRFVDAKRPVFNFNLLPVALTIGGVSIAPLGLGHLKRGASGSKLQVELGNSSFPVSYSTAPALAAAAVTTGETDGAKKVLDLSRPIRAGPRGDPGMTFNGSVSSQAGGAPAGFRILVTGSELHDA